MKQLVQLIVCVTFPTVGLGALWTAAGLSAAPGAVWGALGGALAFFGLLALDAALEELPAVRGWIRARRKPKPPVLPADSERTVSLLSPYRSTVNRNLNP